MAVRVLVVGKDPLARAGLLALLSREPRITLVGDAAPEELDEALEGAGVDVLLVDTPSSLDALAAGAGAPAVALVAEEGAAADALGAGARGVLLRDAGPAQIASAVEAAASGLVSLDASLAATLLRPRASLGPPGDALTPREHQVLQLLALGLTNKSIAARLGISDHTAKFHVNAILSKLGAGSRSEAIVRAARAGLVAL